MTKIGSTFGFITLILCLIGAYSLYVISLGYFIEMYTTPVRVLGVSLWSSISDEDLDKATFLASFISMFVSTVAFLFARTAVDKILYKYRGYRIRKTYGSV